MKRKTIIVCIITLLLTLIIGGLNLEQNTKKIKKTNSEPITDLSDHYNETQNVDELINENTLESTEENNNKNGSEDKTQKNSSNLTKESSESKNTINPNKVEENLENMNTDKPEEKEETISKNDTKESSKSSSKTNNQSPSEQLPSASKSKEELPKKESAIPSGSNDKETPNTNSSEKKEIPKNETISGSSLSTIVKPLAGKKAKIYNAKTNFLVEEDELLEFEIVEMYDCSFPNLPERFIVKFRIRAKNVYSWTDTDYYRTINFRIYDENGNYITRTYASSINDVYEGEEWVSDVKSVIFDHAGTYKFVLADYDSRNYIDSE